MSCIETRLSRTKIPCLTSLPMLPRRCQTHEDTSFGMNSRHRDCTLPRNAQDTRCQPQADAMAHAQGSGPASQLQPSIAQRRGIPCCRCRSCGCGPACWRSTCTARRPAGTPRSASHSPLDPAYSATTQQPVSQTPPGRNVNAQMVRLLWGKNPDQSSDPQLNTTRCKPSRVQAVIPPSRC